MDWKSIGRAVGTAAPVLGTLLGGPAGAAVGSLVASALGTDNSPDAVNAVLASDPTALAKVQELQINAKIQLQQIAASVALANIQADQAQFAAEVADRDSARQLAAKQPHDIIRPAIALILLAGAIFIIIAVFTGIGKAVLTDPTATVTIGIVTGFWFNEVKQVMGFYYGTTKDASTVNRDITKFAVSPDTVVASKDMK